MATTFLLPKENRTAEGHHAQSASGLSVAMGYLKNPRLARLFAEIFLFYFSFSAYVAGFALFAERRFKIHGVPVNATQIGYAFAYFGFLGIIIQGFMIGRVIEKFGERRVVLFGFLSSVIGYAILGFVNAPIWIAVTGLFTGFGGGVLRPVLVSEIAGQVNPRERGSVIGVNQSIQSLAQIVAPIAGTALIGRSELLQWALLPSCLCAVGAILVVLRSRTKTPQSL
jgi:DHA1 family tetracycline resistance protein-like MFS transporter